MRKVIRQKTKIKSKNDKFKSGLERTFHERHPLPYEPDRFAYTVKPKTYCPDFKVSKSVYIETKGRFLAADRSKHLYIQQQHPDLTILFVFQNPSLTLSKKSKTTYADWCDQHGFKWMHIDDTADPSALQRVLYK